jgi:uncharacterized membrane protein (UPF0127 family)
MPVKDAFYFVIIVSLFLSRAVISNDIDFDKGQINLAGEAYVVEIARSTKQRRHGLMYRDHLGKRQGMLFIYPRSGDHRIWMKNTLIPLTVIWFDETRTVIGIKKLIPCTTEFCPGFGVSKPSKYVLELNGENHSVKPGLKFNSLFQLK